MLPQYYDKDLIILTKIKTKILFLFCFISRYFTLFHFISLDTQMLFKLKFIIFNQSNTYTFYEKSTWKNYKFKHMLNFFGNKFKHMLKE